MSADIFACALAEADAEDQAQFFNNFYRHLVMICKGREETQICYIADHLDENGRKFSENLNAFAKLAVESRAKHENEIGELYRQKRALEDEISELNKIKESETPQ